MRRRRSRLGLEFFERALWTPRFGQWWGPPSGDCSCCPGGVSDCVNCLDPYPDQMEITIADMPDEACPYVGSCTALNNTYLLDQVTGPSTCAFECAISPACTPFEAVSANFSKYGDNTALSVYLRATAASADVHYRALLTGNPAECDVNNLNVPYLAHGNTNCYPGTCTATAIFN